ncbi:MAG TPA: hypothetical protein VF265_04255 [Nevskiaceae bacterium]
MKKSRGTGVLLAFALATCMTLAGTAQAQDSTPVRTGDAQAAQTQNVETPSAGAMAADLILVRPLGLAATAVGFGLFLANTPFLIFEGRPKTAPWNKLVRAPAAYTFKRPLGKMSD